MRESSRKTPQDVKKGWLNVARAAQAACSGNKGFGIISFTVVVSGNEPLIYLEPELKKIHPHSMSAGQISPALLGVLLNLADHVDNNAGGTVE